MSLKSYLDIICLTNIYLPSFYTLDDVNIHTGFTVRRLVDLTN